MTARTQKTRKKNMTKPCSTDVALFLMEPEGLEELLSLVAGYITLEPADRAMIQHLVAGLKNGDPGATDKALEGRFGAASQTFDS